MERSDNEFNIVEITHNGHPNKWLVFKKVLDVPESCCKEVVTATEVSIAFPVDGARSSDNCLEFITNQQWPVFAYLPLRSFGFRFIIQGDFEVPSSREDVNQSSVWNQWLVSQLPDFIMDCLHRLMEHPLLTPTQAIATFLKFIPMEDEILGFFKQVPRELLRKLKTTKWLPGDEESVGKLMPAQTVYTADQLIKSVITSDFLSEHLNLYYIHPDLNAIIKPPLSSFLGIEMVSSVHVLEISKQVGEMCCKIWDDGDAANRLSVINACTMLLGCVYKCYDSEIESRSVILDTVKSSRLIPTSNGCLRCVDDMECVFFPLNSTQNQRSCLVGGRKQKELLAALEQDIVTVDSRLIADPDNELVCSQVQHLLECMGVKSLQPRDVMESHIIPILKSDQWKEKPQLTVVSYLVFIKEQLEVKALSAGLLGQVKELAVVLTSSDSFVNPATEAVHFSQRYGTRFHLPQYLPGIDWTLVSDVYLQGCDKIDVDSWRNFLMKLGVVTDLHVKELRVVVDRDDGNSPWSSLMPCWPQTQSTFTVVDFSCDEFYKLASLSSADVDGKTLEVQRRNLFHLLSSHWSEFNKYIGPCDVFDSNGHKLHTTDSSFAIHLKSLSWVPSTICDLDDMLDRKYRQPTSLFFPHADILRLLSDHVAYLDTKNLQDVDNEFLKFLGMRTVVTKEELMKHLKIWSRKSNGESTDNSAGGLFSLAHMNHVYTYLAENCSRNQLQEYFSQSANQFVFLPNQPGLGNPKENVEGHFIPSKMLCWEDPTGLYRKHKNTIVESNSVPECHYLSSCYPNLHNLFVDVLDVRENPRVNEYCQLLIHVAIVKSVDNCLEDVFTIFAMLGRKCEEVMNRTASEDQTNQKVIAEQLANERVIPTKSGMWVAPTSHPVIADDISLEKLFQTHEKVHFIETGNPGPLTNSKLLVSNQMGHVQFVFDLLKVKNISECLTKQTDIVGVLRKNFSVHAMLHQITPFVQRFIHGGHPAVHAELVEKNIAKRLQEFQFYEAEKISVNYRLDHVGEDVYHMQEETCLIDEKFFYIKSSVVEDRKIIVEATVNFFSLKNNDCKRQLKMFLSNIINNPSTDVLEELLKEEYPSTIPNDVEKWNIPPPVLIQYQQRRPPINEHSQTQGDEESLRKRNDGNLSSWPPPRPEDCYGKKKISLDVGDPEKKCVWPEPPPPPKDHPLKPFEGHKVTGAPSSSTTHRHESGEKNEIDSVYNNERTHPSSSKRPGKGYTTSDSDGDRDRDTCGSVQSGNNVRRTAVEREDTSVSETDSKNNEMKHVEPEGQLTDSNQPKTDVTHEQPVMPEPDGDTNVSHTDSVLHPANTNGHPLHRIYIDPLTTSAIMTDSVIEITAAGVDTDIPDNLEIDTQHNSAEIAAWGEEFVFRRLSRIWPKDVGVEWINKNNESDLPYDITVTIPSNNGNCSGNVLYIEVKSSVTADKNFFEISNPQLKFAQSKGENYHVYRVQNAGSCKNVKMFLMKNLDNLLSKKVLTMCVFFPSL